MPQFRTKTGRLTAYSFACGYIEQRQWRSIGTTLWHEGACYHVRQHDTEVGRVFWHCFDTLAEARNCFNRCRGKLV